jgi:hypothetical protein
MRGIGSFRSPRPTNSFDRARPDSRAYAGDVNAARLASEQQQLCGKQSGDAHESRPYAGRKRTAGCAYLLRVLARGRRGGADARTVASSPLHWFKASFCGRS